jgi:hypothetical protein
LLTSAAQADAARQVPPELSKAALYSEETDFRGIRIRYMPGVSAAAVEIAKDRLGQLLAHLPVVEQNLVDCGAELRIMTGHPDTDVTGGLVSYATEENILKNERDRFSDHRDICIHECSHMLHLAGFGAKQRAAIEQRYSEVLAEGLWPHCYALSNDREFFAELAMWYFGTRGDYGQLPDPQEGRAWLASYDPKSFKLLDDIFQGRIESERIEWHRLPDLGAQQEAKLRSLEGVKRCQIVFSNQTSEPLAYWWLDYEGKRVLFGEVGPHERASMDTFETHPWVMLRLDGSVAAIFVPDGPNCLAEVL